MKVAENVTELMGGTPIVRLDAFADNIVGKVEAFNPMASVKDRIGVAMIDQAEKEGLIDEATTIIEPTSGNTGLGLAFTCAAKGYELVLTMPASMSEERRALLKELGADIVLTPADDGMAGAIDEANEVAAGRDNTFIPQQFQNLANPWIHRTTTGPEIWDATDGEADVLVAGVGTGGTITGVSEYIKEERGVDDFTSIAVEPASSAVLSGETSGSHSIQGIGAGFIPEVLRIELVDEVLPVTVEDATEMTRLLARKEGLLTGISSGAALHAAVDVADRPGHRDDLVVVVLPDTGERYLSTDLYQP